MLSLLQEFIPFLRSRRKGATSASKPPSPEPPSAPFNLVQAAQALLDNAKKLGSASPVEEEQLSRAIAMSAKRISSETVPVMDALKLEWLMMADIAAWRLFMEWKAFDHIPVGGSVAISDLAVALNAQESLVGEHMALKLVGVPSMVLIWTSAACKLPHRHRAASIGRDTRPYSTLESFPAIHVIASCQRSQCRCHRERVQVVAGLA